MFTIIISEKGGAERRETFDRNEINVGRVQGNDLMLPKGNVSKHHARLLYRDGRFIVTDLKSTNGTYVNGRKISQATIVREGDKIYIGDFVLRLETGQAAGVANENSSEDVMGRVNASRVSAAAIVRDGSSNPPPDAPTGVPPAPPGGATLGNLGSLSAPPLSPGLRSADASQAVSHFPLERDPDSESAPDLQGTAMPRVPGPPRLPQADARPRATTAMLGAAPPPPAVARSLPRPTQMQAARRRALVALVERVAGNVDLAALDRSPMVPEALVQQIDASAQAQARAMRDAGEAPEGLDLAAVARDALLELVGLGPLGALLEDDHIAEVHVPRPDVVLAVREGQVSLVETSFSSEEALSRVVGRLAHGAGEEILAGEAIIERRLARGARMTALAPPRASAWALTIRKPVRTEGSLDEHVRAGALSRSMATLLEACMAARANVLVVGAGAGTVSPMIAALASASGTGERIAFLTDTDDLQVAHAYVTRVAVADRGARADEVLRAAAHLRPDRLVLGSLAGPLAGPTIEAIAEGTEGVVAGVAAPSLRSALARLAAQVGLARSGASIESAREAIAESFDLAIEIVRSVEGRARVSRISELAGADSAGVIVRDLFVSNADGTGEAGFIATGVTPRFAQDFITRGVRLDPALFKRR
jgi:pilus assembly protein CpaF